MKKELLLILLCYSISYSCIGQTGCDDCDSSYVKIPPYVKKDHKKYKTDSCDLSRFKDNKTAKNMYCEAMYYCSIKNYFNATELLLLSYSKSTSAKLKFQILKSVVYTSKMSGDNKRAATFQEKVDKVLSSFPDIEK